MWQMFFLKFGLKHEGFTEDFYTEYENPCKHGSGKFHTQQLLHYAICLILCDMLCDSYRNMLAENTSRALLLC